MCKSLLEFVCSTHTVEDWGDTGERARKLLECDQKYHL